MTLNEEKDEVRPGRKDKTPNDTWVAFWRVERRCQGGDDREGD